MSQLVSPTASIPAGCVIQPLDAEACERYLAWLLGEQTGAIPDDNIGAVWALGHCDDGVTWGRYDLGVSCWRFGNRFFADVSPAIRRESLQELRIFGANTEVLIWRTETRFRGRALLDNDPPADRNNTSDPLRPSDESRILRGDRVSATAELGFSRITDRAGAEQVIPISVTDLQLQERLVRVVVRHYYEQDCESGAVRIFATRLVELKAEDSNVD